MMKGRRLLALTLLGLLPAVATSAPVAVLTAVECDVTEPVCILVVPDGSGPSFAEARTADGTVVDATIRLYFEVYDEFGGPYGPAWGAPPEDGWLEMPGGQVLSCAPSGLLHFDAPSDDAGWAVYAEPPRAGGWFEGELIPVYSDSPSLDGAVLPISFNSPDLDGDLDVDLSDVVLFAQDLAAGTHPFRSDLLHDGLVNLSDVVVMASHVGAACD
jgi:hypothetical protein